MRYFTAAYLAGVMLAASALSVPLAAAADDAPAAARNLNVVGIHLGMTQDEVVAVLAKYDPKFEVTKMYYCAGMVADSHDCFHKAKIMPIVQLNTLQNGVEAQSRGYSEGVAIQLSPQSQRVISVTYLRTYDSARPGASSVIDKAIIAKFPADSVKVSTNTLQIGYFVDRDGRSLNGDIVKHNHLDQGDANQNQIMMFIANADVPPQAIPDGGIGFAGRVDEYQGAVSAVRLCLLNWDALADAAVQEAKIDKLNAIAKNEALAKQTTNTKF
jgi:hypothetical protein